MQESCKDLCFVDNFFDGQNFVRVPTKGNTVWRILTGDCDIDRVVLGDHLEVLFADTYSKHGTMSLVCCHGFSPKVCDYNCFPGLDNSGAICSSNPAYMRVSCLLPQSWVKYERPDEWPMNTAALIFHEPSRSIRAIWIAVLSGWARYA